MSFAFFLELERGGGGEFRQETLTEFEPLTYIKKEIFGWRCILVYENSLVGWIVELGLKARE